MHIYNSVPLVGIFIVLSAFYLLAVAIYRLFFHPLCRVPGPWINAVSRVPFAGHLLKGTTAANVERLHKQYGEVVRLSPNEVSFISGETAWQDIYGFRTGKHKGEENLLKDNAWYPPITKGMSHILIANDADHTRYRRVYSHAFSEKALGNQEGLIQQYVDLLIGRLKEVVASRDDSTQDLSMWYNWTTFDVVADLTFGEPFGCLRDLKTDKFIGGIYDALNSWSIYYVMHYWPILSKVSHLFLSESFIKGRIELFRWVKARTEERIAADTERQDFMTEVTKHNGDKGVQLTTTEIANNNVVLLVAGSETTATLLSGTTYLLLKNPAVMQKLKDDVRSRWKRYDDITLDEVNKASYLIAVLQEGLRLFPPVPTGFERRVGKGGAIVSGYYLPEGTATGVSQVALGRSELYFTDPKAFIPERWTGDERFENDKRSIVQPFNFGPRNCIGKNLAYAEMRLILAKMIWSFDLTLDPRCHNWMQQCRVKTAWMKPPLLIEVIEVTRD